MSAMTREQRVQACRLREVRRQIELARNPGWRLIDLPLFGPTKVPDRVEVYFVSACGKVGNRFVADDLSR